MNNKSKARPPKPIIVWVGGKRKIVDKLLEHIPPNLNNYYEPFLGGGALFFNVRDRFKNTFLSDINLDLITSYNAIKKTPDQVCKLVNHHEQNHSKDYFYQIKEASNSNDPSIISARFLYLNRYSFRGIYKLNTYGNLQVNCSSRTYKSKLSGRIKQSSDFLKSATIYAGDFSFIEPSSGDFVYFDPPYHNSSELFYTRLPFDESEQRRLKHFIDSLTLKGVKIMLSNNETDFILGLYKEYNIRTLEVRYSIDSNTKAKKEVLITNY